MSRALAGPYATSLLSDLGAYVIKVESIRGGDSSRDWPPFDGEYSLYFDSVNRGKHSIAIDMYTAAGKELIRELAATADVLVENFRPGVMAAMGLDPAELRARTPGLIVASVTGFGTSGPLAQAPGLDQVAQGMTGLMSVTGPDSEHVYRVGVPIVDLVSGMNTALGIVAGLVGRGRDGTGVEVSTSLLESGLALGVFQSQRYLSTGQLPTPQGNTHPSLTPYGVFATADLPVIIATGSQKQWLALCGLLGAPELAQRPDYADAKLRHAHEPALRAELETLLRAETAAHWLPLLRTAGIPSGPIYNYQQVFADPQVRTLNIVETVQRADGTELPLVRGPISINGEPPRVGKPPPALGQDSLEVLSQLQLTDEQVARLLLSGVVLDGGASCAEQRGSHRG